MKGLPFLIWKLWPNLTFFTRMAAFKGMHVLPAKHSYEESVATGQTQGKSDPCVPICFAGDTKVAQCEIQGHKVNSYGTMWKFVATMNITVKYESHIFSILTVMAKGNIFHKKVKWQGQNYSTMWKVLSQGMHMRNMKALSLVHVVWKP